MHLAKELILKKREGEALSPAEISAFVEGVSDHTVSDAQIAAFAMATWFRGMDLREEVALTLAMRDSGEVLEWPGLDGPVLDKHSTGGVGDLVSLVLGPVLASCGAYVPMISGRGLGHTGGTLDKMESIPGVETQPDLDRFRAQVRDIHLAIVGQTDRLAPADRRIYAVRDVTATVASTPLIIASILSKKLAEGLDGLVMDVKFGSGAFTPGLDEAQELARAIVRVAEHSGLSCRALITGMEQPLARSAGNALEVLEAISLLRGDAADGRLLEVVLALSGELMALGGLAANREQGVELARQALVSGGAAEAFARMVTAQGGPAGLLEAPERFLPAARVVRPVHAEQAGFVERMDCRAIGMVVVGLGGGRRQASDAVDPSVGLSRLARIGQEVGADTPLAIVHAASEDHWNRAADYLRLAIEVGSERVRAGPLTHELSNGTTS
jgi:thymidine phosphorylase